MLDVRKLATLREIAACGSFSAAAHRLNYSQSAISQQVAQLERQLGTALIERGRVARLTPAGQALVDRVGPILRQLVAAEADLEALTGARRSALSLTAFASAAATVLPAAIARFRRHHPDVAITMTIADSVAALCHVADSEADIAVVSRSESALDSTTAFLDLLDDPMEVALPRGHELAARPCLRLGELSGESWLLATGPDCADWEIFVAACRRAGFEPRIGFRHDDYLALQGLVAAGLGVALLPALAMRIVRDDIVVCSLGADGPVRHIAAAVCPGARQSPTVTAMLNALRDSAAGYRPAVLSAG